jgi:hypothetical protein
VAALRVNTTGVSNTAVGQGALVSNTTGTSNVAIGLNSGCAITTGGSNVIVGGATATGFETESGNIFISDGVGNIRVFTKGSTGNIGLNNTDPSARLDVSGSVRFRTYGTGTNTGTPLYYLAVDVSGSVIEQVIGAGTIDGSGASNQVAVWADVDTVSGSNSFTWDGTKLTIVGTLEATEKSFVIDHPTQPGNKLVYGVLEGPEHAVYCRGKISGEIIELPEEWTGLVDSDSITVQLTPIDKHQSLYVAGIRNNRVVVKNADLLSSKVNAYYFIQGTRKDVKPLQTVRPV